jgi:hypothetical protein
MTPARHVVLAAALLATVPIAGILTTSSRADALNPPSGSAPVTLVGPLPLPIRGIIANDDGSPIPVRDVDQAVREPVQVDSELEIFDDSHGVATVVKVPSGKRLVVEHVSAFVQTQSGAVTAAGLSAGNFVDSVPCSTMSPDLNGRPHFACSVLTKYFVEPDRTLLFFVSTSAASGGALRVFVSGYYVPVS